MIRVEESDRQCAGFSLCRPTGFHSRLFDTIENVLSLAKETVSCSSELNRGFGADEQLYFQFLLERFDLLADSGLSNAKLFRCSGEALLFGDAREVKKITELHC